MGNNTTVIPENKPPFRGVFSNSPFISQSFDFVIACRPENNYEEGQDEGKYFRHEFRFASSVYETSLSKNHAVLKFHTSVVDNDKLIETVRKARNPVLIVFYIDSSRPEFIQRISELKTNLLKEPNVKLMSYMVSSAEPADYSQIFGHSSPLSLEICKRETIKEWDGWGDLQRLGEELSRCILKNYLRSVFSLKTSVHKT